MRLGKSSVTAITDYNFRTLGEVERVLATLDVPKVEVAIELRRLDLVDTKSEEDGPTYKVPEGWTPGTRVHQTKKFKTSGVKGEPVKLNQRETRLVKSLTNAHHEMQDQKEKLNALKVNAINTFRGSKYEAQIEKTLGLFDKREKELLEAELKSHTEMHQIAEKLIPEQIHTTFAQILNPVLKGLEGKFKGGVKRYTLAVIPGTTPLVQFEQIVQLNKLKNDKGFVYPQFYLIVTCIIGADNHYHYYVDTSTHAPAPNVSAPDSHNRGFPFTKVADGRRLLQSHLMVDESIDLNVPTALPKSKDEIEGTVYRNSNIRTVKVDENAHTIQFTVKPVGPKILEKVTGDILADLAGIFHNKNVHEKLKHKTTKLANNGGFKIVVWVGTPTPRVGKDYQSDSSKVAVLKHELNLDDSQEKQILRLLRGRSPNKADEHAED